MRSLMASTPQSAARGLALIALFGFLIAPLFLPAARLLSIVVCLAFGLLASGLTAAQSFPLTKEIQTGLSEALAYRLPPTSCRPAVFENMASGS